MNDERTKVWLGHQEMDDLPILHYAVTENVHGERTDFSYFGNVEGVARAIIKDAYDERNYPGYEVLPLNDNDFTNIPSDMVPANNKDLDLMTRILNTPALIFEMGVERKESALEELDDLIEKLREKGSDF
jgi:hypothetical protein